MRPHRAFSPGLTGVLPLRETRHLVEVLRARVGDRFTVFDGEREALAEVVDLGPPLRYRVLEERRPEREVGVEVVLYVALLKGDKLAEVVRAATELGATRIQPLVTRHSVPKEMGEGKLRRLRAVALEAAKQSGRVRVPEVLPPIPLKAVPQVAQGLVAHVGATARVREVLDPEKPLALAVGPEGGFAEEEVALLEARGFTPVSLGRRIPLLAACRYTFLPLDPGKPPPPERPFVVARLLPEGKEARLLLKVERLPRPGYLHLKWFREEALLQEKALFLEGPGAHEARFPLGSGYHRLVGLWEGRPLFQLDLGSPSLPDPEEVEDQGDGEEGQEGGDHHAPGHP